MAKEDKTDLDEHLYEYGVVYGPLEAKQDTELVGGKYTWFKVCNRCGSTDFKITNTEDEDGERTMEIFCTECGSLQNLIDMSDLTTNKNNE